MFRNRFVAVSVIVVGLIIAGVTIYSVLHRATRVATKSTPVPTLAVSGSVNGLITGGFRIQSNIGTDTHCGLLRVITPVHVTVGQMARAVGSGSCSTQLVASSIVILPTTATKHVRIWTWYGENHVADSVPASWMAANATFVVGPLSYVNSFHNAGGLYGVAYTNPVDVIVANHEPMWDVPEAGWFHDSGGKRIWRTTGNGNQESLNPAASSTRGAYNALTASIKVSSRGYALVETDNVSWDVNSAFYRFNARGVESSTNAAYTSATEGLLGSSALPTIINGMHNNAGGLTVSGDTVFLPYSAGGLSENCMQDAAGPQSDAHWMFSENTMLYVTRSHRWAVCQGEQSSSDNRVNRMYFLASWWLTYDPNYSAAFPGFASAGKVEVFPEFRIVPTKPVQTAVADISELKIPTGAYARQFHQCFNYGFYFGGCVAIVNPSSTLTVPMPSLAATYHHLLVLDSSNTYNGGKIAWGTAIPSLLAPKTAVVLAK